MYVLFPTDTRSNSFETSTSRVYVRTSPIDAVVLFTDFEIFAKNIFESNVFVPGRVVPLTKIFPEPLFQ
jgi:hypothetical protein